MSEEDLLKNYISSKVKPIFEKSLQEMKKNHMMVGSVGFNTHRLNTFCFFQPHNLRHFFDYDKRSFNFLDPTLNRLGVVTPKLNNSGREYFFENFKGCNITVKKTQIQIKNNVDFKKWYKIKVNREDHLNIHVSKIKESVKVLKAFIEVYGGVSNFNVLNISSEDKFMNESFIDNIGIKERFHNEVVKKVYNDSVVEFPPAFASNYLSSQASLTEDFNIVEWCEKNINHLEDVFLLEKMIELMSDDYKLFVSNFLFSRFGGVTSG